VADDAVLGWLAGLDAPGLARTWRVLAFLGSWWVLNLLGFGLVLALLVLRRFRHLIVVLVVTQLLTMVLYHFGSVTGCRAGQLTRTYGRRVQRSSP
jgi:hypothetical protein